MFTNMYKKFSWRWFADYGMIILGSMIMAAGYSFFADPLRIVPGGVYGIAIVFHHLYDFSTGTVGLILNIPLFIIGIYVLGPKFGVKTFAGTILTSFFMDYFSSLTDKPLTDDIMLGSVFSGVLIGAGLALIFKAKATSGGSDIVAQIINKYTGMSIGQLLIILDSLVVTVGIIAFKDLSLALYALITIFITGKVLDAILMGGSYRKAAFIISDKHEEIAKVVTNKMQRGGTFFHGAGMYSGKEKEIILTAVNRRELVALQQYVRQIDPDAFMTVFNTNQIYGEGFSNILEDV